MRGPLFQPTSEALAKSTIAHPNFSHTSMSHSNMQFVAEHIISNKAMFSITPWLFDSQSFSGCSVNDYVLSSLKV